MKTQYMCLTRSSGNLLGTIDYIEMDMSSLEKSAALILSENMVWTR